MSPTLLSIQAAKIGPRARSALRIACGKIDFNKSLAEVGRHDVCNGNEFALERMQMSLRYACRNFSVDRIHDRLEFQGPELPEKGRRRRACHNSQAP